MTPIKPGARVKTDRRDAIKLAELFSSRIEECAVEVGESERRREPERKRAIGSAIEGVL